MVKSVLGSLGSYLMSVFLTPLSVLKALEEMRARFFWGANRDERRMHWVRWYIVITSREEGGLGIGSLFYLSGGGGFISALTFCGLE